MRNAFSKAIFELSKKNKDCALLVGDIGNKLFDDFKSENPDRFVNCGISEANMTGVAAGMAMNGFKPFTYTIAPFNTYRCLEQIKIDVCYHNLPVTIVGTGAGLSYSSLGATHHTMEDIAIMRSLPNMKVVCPGDPVEVQLAVKEAYKEKGPVYIRLGKKGEPIIHKQKPIFKIGKAIEMAKGREIMIISVGNVFSIANECFEILNNKHISTGLVSLHTVKPLDTTYLKKIINFTKKIVVIEEHGFTGGVLSALLEFCHKENLDQKKFFGFNSPDKFISFVGNQENARKSIGLTVKNIIKKIFDKL